jgi:hypothetical protein
MPSAAIAIAIESAATPGSAICTARPSADSTISIGGSHAASAWVKKCR